MAKSNKANKSTPPKKQAPVKTPAVKTTPEVSPEPESEFAPGGTAQTFAFVGRPWAPGLLVALSALIAYAVTVGNDFVYFDDDQAILNNPMLKNPSLGGFFGGQNLGMYAPITWIGYWLVTVFFGEGAWGFHLASLLIHALNGFLMYQFLRLLTERNWVALAAALLFAVHPVQAEAVCWAAGFSTVLFTTFYIASLAAYVQWRKSNIHAWLYGSIGLFVAANLSKSAAVTLPLALILIDYFIDKKLIRKFWLSKIPYFIFSLLFGFYTFVTRAREGHDITNDVKDYDLLDRLWMVSQTLLFYPAKLLAPLGFTVSYPFPAPDGPWPWYYYAAPPVLAGLAWLFWTRWRKNPWLVLGIGLYVLPLGVMLPFRTVGSFELRSDRYVYFSAVGLFLLLAYAAERLKPIQRNLALGVVAAVLTFLSIRQARTWENGVALFGNCVRQSPESAMCQCNLGYSELLALDFSNAATHYSEALKLDKSYVEAYNGRGQAYFNLRKVPEALSDFTNALEAGIRTPKLFFNRGRCLVMTGKFTEAIADLNESIVLEPNFQDAYFFRGFAHEKSSNLDAAIKDYQEAVRIAPNYVQALVNLGVLLMNAERYEESIESFSRAIEQNPNMEMIWNNRAFAYFKTEKYGMALSDADKAIEINQKYAKAYQTRAQVLEKLGKPDKAASDLQMATQLGAK